MGDRALFQDTETDTECKDIHRYKRKCVTHTDLDSHDIAFDNKMAAPSLKNEMVVLRNECDVKTESLYVQAITGMAGQTVRNAAGGAGAGTTINIQLRYWTAKGGQEENNK